MRLAIISDIHGNLEALSQVLADIDDHQMDKIINLGDNIGYGPDSEAVLECITARGIPSIMGNHELALLEPELLKWFNPMARESLNKTRDMLSDDSVTFIKTLEEAIVFNGHTFVHGFPPDSVTTYLFDVEPWRLDHTFKEHMDRLCFVGHSHRLEIVVNNGKKIERRPLRRGLIDIDPSNQYIINVGSVGQPRDTDNRAKYVIFDDAAGTLEVRFVQYDIVMTANKIIDAGLPSVHANRLF